MMDQIYFVGFQFAFARFGALYLEYTRCDNFNFVFASNVNNTQGIIPKFLGMIPRALGIIP